MENPNKLSFCQCADRQVTCRQCGEVTMLSLAVAGPDERLFCCDACAETYTRDMIEYTRIEADAARERFHQLTPLQKKRAQDWNAYANLMNAKVAA